MAEAIGRQIERAHGGAALAAAKRVHVRFSSGGLAFAVKGQPNALSNAEAEFDPHRQEIVLRGSRPQPWEVSIDGADELKARLASLRRGRRRLRWTPRDVGIFAAGALWTYMTMPLLVAGAAPRADNGGRRVRVDLGDGVAGHGRRQTLYLGAGGLIVRHDYTASAFGRWARAAQTIEDHRCFDGVVVGTRREVTPRVARWRLPGPTLVWIVVHDLVLDTD